MRHIQRNPDLDYSFQAEQNELDRTILEEGEQRGYLRKKLSEEEREDRNAERVIV